MNNITFTIAIATYNSAGVICALLDSICFQTYTNYEVVVVDGQSKDKTLELIKNRLPCNKTKILCEPDYGVYDALNKALCMASGDYLIVMGSDDHFLSYHVLQEVADAIEKDGKDPEAIYYGGTYMECCHQVVNKVHTRWSWVKGTICHQCIFYPRAIYKEYAYNLKYPINADYAYNLLLWNKARFKHIDVIVSFFSSSGMSGGNVDIAFRHDLPELIRTHCGVFPYWYKRLRLFMGILFKGRNNI